jgi:lysophospholipase L1-like esterase
VGRLNAALATLAAENGCEWVDLVPVLAPISWTDDGIHLNTAAYRVVAPLLQFGLGRPGNAGVEV